MPVVFGPPSEKHRISPLTRHGNNSHWVSHLTLDFLTPWAHGELTSWLMESHLTFPQKWTHGDPHQLSWTALPCSCVSLLLERALYESLVGVRDRLSLKAMWSTHHQNSQSRYVKLLGCARGNSHWDWRWSGEARVNSSWKSPSSCWEIPWAGRAGSPCSAPPSLGEPGHVGCDTFESPVCSAQLSFWVALILWSLNFVPLFQWSFLGFQ